MNYKNYQAVKKFDTLEAYLHHFSQTSMKNEIPGLLSFFFIQGQSLLPYVRIPTGDTHLDPRVHVFWIQPSRTGKSVAWNFIGDVMKEAELDYELYSTGTDAGLIGSNKPVLDENNKPTGETEKIDGLLSGKKGLNVDEGSIILNPGKHSQETVLYLQTACNAVGSGGNILTKPMKGDIIKCESLVSLWITTYPPKGVKEYVLTKGIFQRVLLYWSHWDMDMRQEVSNTRLGTFWKKPIETDLTKDDIYDYFKDTEKRVRDRLLNFAELTFTQWTEMNREEQEEIAQQYMWDMFSADDDYETALYQASDEVFDLLRNMSASMSEIVASFTPAIENYLAIISLHMAVLDKKWTITAQHVDMAFDILLDLFKNLISWLEDSVEINSNKSKENKIQEDFVKVYDECTGYEIVGHGDGWKRQSSFEAQYMSMTGVSKSTVRRHIKDYAGALFNIKKSGGRIYFRRKGAKKYE
jgi:hypothetical protein|tara:strand:+ start:1764 stop:3167 length:1404 start_codon:yes stop_codon:yes gene_type:complete